MKKVAVNSSVNYRSLNPAVASVNSKGVVTAGQVGSTYIIMSTADGAITRKIKVNVTGADNQP